MKRFLFPALVAAAIVGLATCGTDDNNSNDGKQPGTNPDVVMAEVALSGTVTDASGAPLAGVAVSTGSESATTDAEGRYRLSKAGTVGSRAVIRFAKAGYHTLIRAGAKEGEMTVNATLRSRGGAGSLQTTFNAGSGETLKVGNMQAEIPASAIVKADGSAYTGTVNADMLYLDPNDDDFAEAMPGGDLAAVRSDQSEAQLVSYGMTEISLTDASGNPLQLKDGEASELTFPIPAGMESNPPATIPLWSFDEARGIWVEEGTATLRGNVYVGEVKHFSWHNLDLPEERVTLRGKVTDCKGAPVAYQKISIEQTIAVTTSEGTYSTYVPANTAVTVMVRSADYDDYSPEVKRQVNGYKGGTVVTDIDLALPCRAEKPEPPDDARFEVEEASIEYTLGGVPSILTFDNFGKRVRMDQYPGTEDHSVTIIEADGTATLYSDGTWETVPMAGYVSPDMILAPFTTMSAQMDLWAGLGMGITTGTETIAGRKCRVVTVPESLATCDEGGSGPTKFGEWNGLMMLAESCGQVSIAALRLTTDVPDVAFTKTLEISWLK